MLTITINEDEFFDDAKQEFVTVNGMTLTLEHSLVSLSRWESKWELPFLSAKQLTDEQTLDYVRMMVIDPPPEFSEIKDIPQKELTKVIDYISSKQTATFFNEPEQKRGTEKIITSEQIYSWMVQLQIPFSCENWHLNRLTTLIKILQIQNSPKKKVPFNEQAARNRELNAQRLKALQTKG